MHGRKQPFTEKNGDIRRSYTVSVDGHRIRSETVRNGFRIRSDVLGDVFSKIGVN